MTKINNDMLDLKNKYISGELEKYAYIDAMNKHYRDLFSYPDLIKESNASALIINEDGVILELKSGIKLYCIKDDAGLIPYTILNFGQYEEKLWDKAAVLLNNNSTILDIGTNIGFFSLYFSKKFPFAKIHCFEPVPRSFEYLQKNLQLNNVSNVVLNNIGMSDRKQSMEMFFNPEGSGSSSLKNLLNAPCTKKIECKFDTLDNYVEENNLDNIDFIKCDVEGAEKFVYLGGLKTIERFKPLIYSEMLRKWSAKFDYHPDEIIELLKSFGYKCYAVSQEGLRLIKKVDEDTAETNFLFSVKNIA